MVKAAPEIAGLVTKIHATPMRMCLVVTGAGTRAVAWLFGEAGASRTLLDAQVPYAMAALHEYVGVEPDQHVSAVEAGRMADAALARARKLAQSGSLEPSTPLAGVSCTATIATDRQKRGDHRCHVAWSDGESQRVYSLVLNKGERDRDGEEEVVSRLILNAVAEACGLDERVGLRLMHGETVAGSD